MKMSVFQDLYKNKILKINIFYNSILKYVMLIHLKHHIQMN